ncbi:MAG: S8 family peptidase, partial [Paramuribaculum sp.]|nr:S8 family peptidase [Paramuribaculum sp.]
PGQESIPVGGSGTAVTSSQFSSAFSSDSYIVVESGVESGNNRYLASLYLDLTAKNLRNPDFVPMLTIEGAAGQGASAYIYSDNDDLLTFGNRGLDGYVSGSPAQSVSSMACGENVIVVGSYNSRNTFPVLKGALMGFNDQAWPVDGVSSFTSYGTTFAGKKLPELCAPGMTVISSVSTPWAKGTAQDVGVFSAKVDRSGLSGAMKAARTDYWEQMQGTSMATPYVSGVVALLLEQDPTLTVHRVRDLLVSTAQAMPADSEPVALKWGAGKLDAENAMRKLLGMPSSIGEVTADTERRFSMEQSDGFITAGIAGESGMRATLTSIAGLAAATAKGSGDVVEIATSGLAPGVYVLTVEGDSGSVISRKVIVK